VYERLPTLAGALDAFLDDLALLDRSPLTVKTYRHHLAPLAVPGPVAAFDAARCRSLIAARMRAGSAGTARTLAIALGSFGSYCVAQGWLPHRPMDGVPRPKPPERPHRYLTADQVRALWAACSASSPRYRAENQLILLLLLEGLRRAEVLGLRWVDYRAETLAVMGKGRRPRVVAVGPLLAAALAAVPRSRAQIVSVRPSAFDSRVKTLGKRAGIPGIHPHLFRHSWASNWLLEGGSTTALMQLGGWTTDKMIRSVYARSVLSDVALRESRALGLTERLLSPPEAPQRHE